MRKNPSNIGASVRARLYNLAAQRKIEFNRILDHYAIERLLYRLSVSKYRTKFILKGAMLFTVWKQTDFRNTRDLDLMGYVNSSLEGMTIIFQEICSQVLIEDGILYLKESIVAEEIKSHDEYVGVRVSLKAKLDTAIISVQIDIGLGDSISPKPEEIDFPVLLDLPAPKLSAYRVETVVAEKLHAIAKHGLVNTRMKDFYDLYVISKQFEFDGEVIKKSIKTTFSVRSDLISKDLPLGLTSAFFADPNKQSQWTAFLRKVDNKEFALTLEEVINEIVKFLEPIWTSLSTDTAMPKRWPPGGLWQ